MLLPVHYEIKSVLHGQHAFEADTNKAHYADKPLLFLIKDHAQPDELKVMKFVSQQASLDQQKHFSNEINVLNQLKPQQCDRCMQIITHSAADFYWDSTDYSGRFYLMPFYPQGDFAKVLASQELSLAEITHYFMAMLDCVEQLHEQGYLHLDLKPSNFLLSDSFELPSELTLSDFSLAQPITTQPMLSHAGTPRYMSPEQFRQESVNQQTDFYALGLILYQMLTGESAFHAQTYMQWAQQHCQQAVPPLAQSLQSFQPVLDGLLAKHRHYRFSNIEQLRQAFEQACNH